MHECQIRNQYVDRATPGPLARGFYSFCVSIGVENFVEKFLDARRNIEHTNRNK